MIDLKKELNENFYNDIIKCDFLNELKEMIDEEGLINIDLEDIKMISNSLLIGVISKESNDYDENFEIKKINEDIPTDCIINLITDKEITLSNVDNIIGKIKKLYPNIGIIYGVKIKENLNYKYKIEAIFTKGEIKINKPIEKELNDENIIINTFDYENEKDLMYDVSLYLIHENQVSINLIQQKLNIGFNKALKLLNKLEELGIVNKKIGTNPRSILINDLDKIKELIYK